MNSHVFTFHFYVNNAIQNGQFVLNANDEIAESIYDASWYNANKETQLLFVLALRNCLSPPILSAGGLLTLNLETFAQILLTYVC
ncbi:hypothetical protein E2986_13457 [Frieseomelitta varia]|uniref:Uncharacterized protein n=1 Tax=Frieseomelitta varia TaxID=561572 RepID=A0A833S586_9HYME|nr:hypothetical protein E2986_13457 [Frieseomelitta varia]